MNPPGSRETTPTPFGAEPSRPLWPLVLHSVLFALLFALLIWLAILYPAR